MATTIKDIAEKLGFSISTVSRALNNDETLSISPDTRTRILTTAEEMGYVSKKRKSIKNPQKSILVIHKHQTFRNQIDSSYYFAARAGVEDICAKNNIYYTFVPIEEFQLPSNPIDGVLLIGNFNKFQFDVIVNQFGNLPIVVNGIVAYYRDKIDQISYRNSDSVSAALDYLISMGHKSIGYLGITEAPGTEIFGTRKEAFINYLSKLNLLNPQLVFEVDRGLNRVDQGYHLMKQILQSDISLPTAFFCANDPVSIGAIKALSDNDVRVPDDISIIGHDGSFPTQYATPSVTTVDVHPYQLGRLAMITLLDRIKGENSPAKQILLYPNLIVRESVKNLSENNA